MQTYSNPKSHFTDSSKPKTGKTNSSLQQEAYASYDSESDEEVVRVPDQMRETNQISAASTDNRDTKIVE